MCNLHSSERTRRFCPYNGTTLLFVRMQERASFLIPLLSFTVQNPFHLWILKIRTETQSKENEVNDIERGMLFFLSI